MMEYKGYFGKVEFDNEIYSMVKSSTCATSSHSRGKPFVICERHFAIPWTIISSSALHAMKKLKSLIPAEVSFVRIGLSFFLESAKRIL